MNEELGGDGGGSFASLELRARGLETMGEPENRAT